MSQIEVAKAGLKCLTGISKVLLGLPADVDKMKKKDISNIEWNKIKEVDREVFVRPLKMEHMRAFLMVKNASMYKSKNLDSAGMTKKKLLSYLCDSEYTSNYRNVINKNMRNEIWKSNMGNVFESKCFCCDLVDISSTNFVAGHVISVKNGGPTVVENIKPICQNCNSDMSDQNMDEYMEHFNYTKNYDNVHNIVVGFAKLPPVVELSIPPAPPLPFTESVKLIDLTEVSEPSRPAEEWGDFNWDSPISPESPPKSPSSSGLDDYRARKLELLERIVALLENTK